MPDLSNPCFEDMKLQVGARLQLMLQGSQKTTYYSALIGYVAGEYLLVRIPMEHGLSVPMTEGERALIRVFSGVAVFTFSCSIESIHLVPHYYMHLSFPKTIEATPLREAVRVKVHLPAQIKSISSPGSEPKVAALSDLSISGAFVASDSQLGEPGEVVVIAFAFRVYPTNQEVRIETNATIRSTRQINGNGNGKSNGATLFTHGIGIHFEGISPTEQVMLQNYLYQADA